MKLLRFIYLMLVDAHYAWALHDMHPNHPDVPHNVLRRRELRDELCKF